MIYSEINPQNFEDEFYAVQGGITLFVLPVKPPGMSMFKPGGPGPGVGLSIIRLGNAVSNPVPSIIAGFDRSVVGVVGTSTVWSQTINKDRTPMIH
jgi:hypothetical protein